MTKNESNSPEMPEFLNLRIMLDDDTLLELLKNLITRNLPELAQFCIESDDSLTMLETLISLNLLNTDQITELAQMLEYCPIHLCDYRICIDDENAECAHIHSNAPESPELSDF